MTLKDELDRIQEELQETIVDDMRKNYSDAVIDHAMNPRNVGVMSDADGYGSTLGACGDDMEIWLRVVKDRIVETKFWTNGCATTIASGSAVSELAKGRDLSGAGAIGQQEVLDALGGLPVDNEHCALLAANALKEAILDCLKNRREPWKKIYRNRG
ncbi:iron-sulfur cluster assembly scaffold protein [Thermodesulfobacteriota bacterium]